MLMDADGISGNQLEINFMVVYMNLGKFESFANLNVSDKIGDNSSYIHHHLWGSVVVR